jgi:predicted AAA+ superfamily ATPase
MYVKGWNENREMDLGHLWEHLVLDMLRESYGKVHYCLDKDHNEIDFIVRESRDTVHTIECKINPNKYSSKAIQKFRAYYPKGKNFCCSPHIVTPYKLKFGKIEVIFLSVIPS